MSRLDKVIAAQIFLATLPIAAGGPIAGSAPPESSEPKDLGHSFSRAAKGDDPEEKQTTITLTPEQLRRAWDSALAIADDNPPPCRHSDTVTVAEKNAPPIIVIDLGHRFETAEGLVDSGTVNKKAGLVEADIVDAIGGRLANILRGRGHDVVLTRNPHEPMPHTRGNYVASLSVRGLLPAYLSEQTDRPVVLLSIHVDNGRAGGSVYVQNAPDGQADALSRELAEDIAETYRIGAEGAHVNPGALLYEGRGRFDNRMLRSFTAARRTCPKVDGAAALLETGDITWGPDIAAFRRIMRDPGPAAQTIAAGLENFIDEHYRQNKPDPAQQLLVAANPGLKLLQ
ncbi:MAG TPA: N-acetylmuramoyl-L-alanine amidase [Patescibacteria group bacterium]|nr:N-acetylmuramoyl-L-alanine amidase [Patescibacteria group bacterium]